MGDRQSRGKKGILKRGPKKNRDGSAPRTKGKRRWAKRVAKSKKSRDLINDSREEGYPGETQKGARVWGRSRKK